MRKFMLTVTRRDPRLGDEEVIHEVMNLVFDHAVNQAKKWAKKGYWSSIYDVYGECIEEFYIREEELEAA